GPLSHPSSLPSPSFDGLRPLAGGGREPEARGGFVTDSKPLLAVRDLHAWYGESHVLHGVDFENRAGEMVTLPGPNGAGKTTTRKSIVGIVAGRRGSVRYDGHELIDLPSNRIARLGIAFCPEERGIFASLDVEENLLLPPQVRPGGLPVGAIFELFPNLSA